MYLIGTFLEDVLTWLISSEIICTKSPLLYLKNIYPWLSWLTFLIWNLGIIYVNTVSFCLSISNSLWMYQGLKCEDLSLDSIAVLVFYQKLVHMDYNLPGLDYWMYHVQTLLMVSILAISDLSLTYLIIIVKKEFAPCSACSDWWL